ncbi:MAG: hypothetical protein QXQ60_08320 [Thermofilum sp.]
MPLQDQDAFKPVPVNLIADLSRSFREVEPLKEITPGKYRISGT